MPSPEGARESHETFGVHHVGWWRGGDLATRRACAVRARGDIEGIVASLGSVPGGGLFITPAAFYTVNRNLIIELTARHRIPAVYYERAFADSGGLIAYSPNYGEHFLGAAGYIDRILEGARPAELPVQISTKFDLVVNVKAANALGLAVPQTLLASASELIE